MNSEDRLEQVTDLLALWKELRKKWKKAKLEGNPAYHRLNLCINELESALTGKPLSP